MSVRRYPSGAFLPGHTVTISPFSVHSIGPGLASLAGFGTTTGTWPAANRALLFPFVLPHPRTVYKAGWGNGGTVTGNADIGVYDASGVLLVSSGATAKAGANQIQMVDLADTLLAAGVIHYLALASDDQAQFIRQNLIYVAYSGLGCREKAASYPLPNPLTGTAQQTSGCLPVCFLECRAR